MDSGNSGSLQSSSGGDEEYDSRAESISIFLNNPLTHVNPVNNPPPPPPSNHHHQPGSSVLFDPLSNYFDPSPNSLLNVDMVNWSKSLRSDTNPPDLPNFIRPTFPSLQIQQGHGSGSGSASGSGLNNDHANNTGGGTNVRNPKKRSRASRRAPTTVLTTDTTNFRAMVQEFTGIPAPPFSSSSFPRSRLDLFGNSATFRSHFDSTSPPYLLRPFAHKIQPPPPPPLTATNAPTSSMVDAIVSSTTNVNSGSVTNTDHLGLFNPLLNFHPLFQPPPKFPLSSSALPVNDSPLKMGGFEGFGLSHGGSGNANLPGIQSSSSSDHNRVENNWGLGGGGDQGGVLRSINGDNGKLNFSASDFHGDKGQNNAAARTEGMMESWICSSD